MEARIVRRVDKLGRIVMPKELRSSLDIKTNDELEFFLDDEQFIIRKRKSACEFCARTEDVLDFEGHKICRKCIEKMIALL
ncbi:AbrB/MazE/SpoVT family DNA-binding domain-containing protein [Caproiciproducens galactitolivorans]|uniref:AbrB/MazE/SpoVT family DNA-binding domain-containing protein n=1 Tax=Caproiciproducens galactitolivorans TaxID=642589 RepID=A0ABT4BXN1_9FIRM|nr:AbrB/MazE/SpoVT family DNA-binding domain-containing protein [Caproiciproducens galactitolivorans]MCY1714788.1 AbrB/MazE/SpoVT family DNA-binding domain-containing protein [Caproiciproducens galactitolivorans]